MVDPPAIGIVKITLRGVLSAQSVGTARWVLQKTLLDEPVAVVVDLDELTVADQSLLTVFPAAFGNQEPPGAAVLVVCGDPRNRALMSAGVLGRVPVFGSVEDAFEAAAEAAGVLLRTFTLGPVVAAARQARVEVCAACADWYLEHVRDTAAIVVSELVTNAVVHAATDMLIAVYFRGPRLYVSVRDYSHDMPVMMPDRTGQAVAGGRGLRLVAAHSTAWGVMPKADGKIVWAAIRVRPIENDRR